MNEDDKHNDQYCRRTAPKHPSAKRHEDGHEKTYESPRFPLVESFSSSSISASDNCR